MSFLKVCPQTLTYDEIKSFQLSSNTDVTIRVRFPPAPSAWRAAFVEDVVVGSGVAPCKSFVLNFMPPINKKIFYCMNEKIISAL